MPREIRPGIRRLFRLGVRRETRREADDEIRLHLQLRADQLMQEGLSPSEARAEAERRFGSIDEEREQFHAASEKRERRIRTREWLESIAQDLRYAFRTLRRDSAFTAFALAIVALGVGASATIFSVVNGVLLRPMPFRDPSRLVWISNIADDGVAEWRLQVNHFLDVGRRTRTLDGLTGYEAFFGIGDVTLLHAGETERLTRVPVACNFFPFLGVAPALGRSFTEEECAQGAAGTVMLTDALWRQQFGADASIIGKTVTVNAASATVIGVLPPSFDFGSVFAPGTAVDLFEPFPLSEETNRQGNTLAVVGRLKPNASIEQARTDLVALGKQLTQEFPNRNSLRPKVLPLDERVNGRVRPALMVLAFAVAAVMLIVSANLSSLQFARISARRRELSVRMALGARRARLVRQTLTESLALAGGGSLLGVALALVGTRLVAHSTAFDIPLLARVRLDGMALGVVVIVAMVTGMLVGFLPALHALSGAQDALKDGTRGSTRGLGHARVRSLLVVTEIAAACVLVLASSLLVRSFLRVMDVELGYRPDHAMSMRVDPTQHFDSFSAVTGYYSGVLGAARAIPGVTDAALADVLPFGGDRSWGVVGEGQVYPRGQYPEGFIRIVSEGYFKTMGIALRSGRDFTAGDDATSDHVVIMNETLAHKLWPDREAVGQAIGTYGQRGRRVIGVVADVRHQTLEHAFTGELYFPIRQVRDYARVNLVVRTNLPTATLAAAARAALTPVAPEVAKNEWRPLRQLVDKAASPRRFVVLLLGGFTGFALLLAALGIYALVSYGVSQRAQEIGIRLALGASPTTVRVMVMRTTLALAGVGILAGVIGALIVVPSMSGMLFGVTWTDPVSFGGALVMLAVVAVLAGFLPARRASRVDPNVALREG